MWLHSPLSPRKLQNPELRCSSKKLRKSQNLLEGRRPCGRWASSNLPGCYAALEPHSCLARTLPTFSRHSPKQPGPAVSRHWAGVAVFLLYQDLAEIGGVGHVCAVVCAGKWLCKRSGLLPRLGRLRLPSACAGPRRRGDRGEQPTQPCAPRSFVTVPARYQGAQRVPELPRCPVLSGCMPGG